MAEKIEVVIKIPKYYLTHPQDYTCLAECVRRGVLLPRGHGDIVDISELMDMLCLEDNAYNRDNNVAELITLEDIDRLDVIIPADKEKE